MKITVTDQTGKTTDIEGEEDWQLMEAIRDAGLPIKAECGGACASATCHVYIDPDWFGKTGGPNEDEADMLDLAFELQDTSRLACQILLTEELDGLKVTLAPGTEP